MRPPPDAQGHEVAPEAAGDLAAAPPSPADPDNGPTSGHRVRPDVAALYEAHQPAVLAEAKRTLGSAEMVVDGWSADDVSQEVFTDVLDKGMSYVGKDSQVQRWLTTRAKFRALQAHRDQAARPAPVAEPPDDAPPWPGQRPPLGPEEQLEIQEVRRHLVCLAPNERYVWMEAVEKDRQGCWVADDMGLSTGRVSELKAAAAARLAACMGGTNRGCRLRRRHQP